jgi:hypothetical protein
MTVRSSAYLKSRFEDGDTPCEDDFGDWIDTLFDGKIWSAKLVVMLRGPIIVDGNDPQQTLKFQVDASTDSDWSSFIFQVDTSISQSGWEFWNGTDFIQIDPGGLVPAYQDVTYGLVTYTHQNAGNRMDEVYIRYRSGFGFIWSDYQTEKVVLG